MITFALGLGANLAIFSVVDRLMFRPLPYAEPHHLVQIHDRALSSPNPFASLPQYVARELRLRASSFEGFAQATTDRGLVDGVSVHDMRLHVGSPLLFVTLAITAAWVPARRAAQADPAGTLRSN